MRVARHDPLTSTTYRQGFLPSTLAPNASLQLLPEAEAQRTLEAVSCKALFGSAHCTAYKSPLVYASGASGTNSCQKPRDMRKHEVAHKNGHLGIRAKYFLPALFLYLLLVQQQIYGFTGRVDFLQFVKSFVVFLSRKSSWQSWMLINIVEKLIFYLITYTYCISRSNFFGGKQLWV